MSTWVNFKLDIKTDDSDKPGEMLQMLKKTDLPKVIYIRNNSDLVK